MLNYLISDADNLRSVAVIQTDDITKSKKLRELIVEIVEVEDYEEEWILNFPNLKVKDPSLEVVYWVDGIQFNRQIGIKSLPLFLENA